MAKSDYMPNGDPGKARLFTLFRDSIGAYLTTFGLLPTDPDIVGQAADATRFHAVVDFINSLQSSAQAWTAEKNYERDGSGTAPTLNVVPVLPAGFPAAVPAGIVRRFRVLVQRLKSHRNYITATGLALGIEGSPQAAPDWVTLAPRLTATAFGSVVAIGWDWQGYSAFLDMTEIQVDRGGGQGFVLLVFDVTPGYDDKTPFPATPARWSYRAIYRVGDGRVGAWSNTVSVIVAG